MESVVVFDRSVAEEKN